MGASCVGHRARDIPRPGSGRGRGDRRSGGIAGRRVMRKQCIGVRGPRQQNSVSERHRRRRDIGDQGPLGGRTRRSRTQHTPDHHPGEGRRVRVGPRQGVQGAVGCRRHLGDRSGTALVFVNQPETSAIRWTVPGEALYRATLPPAPTGAMTRLGTLWPATKFRFDVPGRVVWSPYTVMTPGLVGAVTVTFNTTADTPELGTPPIPATCRCTVPPAATAAFGAPSPVRVSNTRDGASDPNVPSSVGVPAR